MFTRILTRSKILTNSVKYSSIFSYIKKGNIHKVEQLIQKDKIFVNSKNDEGITPLMIASMENNLNIMKLLIQNGAKLNEQDQLGETALIKAARDRKIEACKYLVESGAQTDIIDNDNMTADEWCLDSYIESIINKYEK